jgi:hypothetical protein
MNRRRRYTFIAESDLVALFALGVGLGMLGAALIHALLQ